MRVIGGAGCRAISLFGDIYRITGRWSKFGLGSTNVIDVYVMGFWAFMKKSSIKLVCV